MRRQELGLSLSELAKKAELSVSYLNEIEKGKKYPKRTKIVLLANALQLSYDQLVSLKISKKLSPLSNLLKSNLLQELPLEVFGIEPRNLLELVSDAPAKLSAFINTIVEISRNYDLTVENLYFSVLRSYQEMHENYFEEVEEAAQNFMSKYFNEGKPNIEDLEKFLKEEHGYEFDEQQLAVNPSKGSLHSFLKDDGEDGKKTLMLHPQLSPDHKLFVLCREAAYNFMEIQDRTKTYSWVRVKSFDELLNHHMASYFAGALLMPEKEIATDLADFLSSETFSQNKFLDIFNKYQVSPEIFLSRLTSILPKFFGIDKIFFLRLNNNPGDNAFKLTKELHLAGLHSPHGTVLSEHYCRRWVSLKIFQQLEKDQLEDPKKIVCNSQVSRYITSGKEYFCITLAHGLNRQPAVNTSITIGFFIDDTLKQTCRFLSDPSIKVEMVNETCERCPSTDCTVRGFAPTVLEKDKREKEIEDILKGLME